MKHKKAILCVSVLALAILAVSFLWKPLRLDRFGNAQIDWVDVVQYNNEKYRSAFPRTEIAPEKIGKTIGKIKFTLSGHVTNPHYAMRNFDAAFLPVHTALFAVKGETDSIAALADGKYYRYEKMKS